MKRLIRLWTVPASPLQRRAKYRKNVAEQRQLSQSLRFALQHCKEFLPQWISLLQFTDQNIDRCDPFRSGIAQNDWSDGLSRLGRKTIVL